MTQRYRIWLLFSLGVAILAVVTLAAGLSQLELRNDVFLDADTLGELRALVAQFGIFRGWLVILYILSPLILFFFLRRIKKSVPLEPELAPRKRRSWLVLVVQAAMWAIAIMILRDRLADGQGLLGPVQNGEMPAFTPPGTVGAISTSIPSWITYVSSMMIVLLVVLVAWTIWRRRRSSEDTLDVVAHEAQFALDELQAGEDFGDVILRCYYEMARALDHHRGIRRRSGMTPREFERRLVGLGLPAEPVRHLTRLFEAVRYGAKQLGHGAEQQAVISLETIVKMSEDAG
jgi:hypothetical protein